jgi:hypothetical protein
MSTSLNPTSIPIKAVHMEFNKHKNLCQSLNSTNIFLQLFLNTVRDQVEKYFFHLPDRE